MNKTKLITRTAVILALAIIFQNLRYFIGAWPNSNIIIGSLVNLCIIVATGFAGIASGIVVSLVTPIVALLQGQLPHVLLAPVTMAGNSVLAIVFYLFLKSRLSDPFNSVIGIIVGAVLKWLVLYQVGIMLVLKVFVKDLPQKKADIIAAAFNFPQIITALIGGVLGIIVIKALKSKKSVD